MKLIASFVFVAVIGCSHTPPPATSPPVPSQQALPLSTADVLRLEISALRDALELLSSVARVFIETAPADPASQHLTDKAVHRIEVALDDLERAVDRGAPVRELEERTGKVSAAWQELIQLLGLIGEGGRGADVGP